ncbi:MAG: hypothetical protein CMJ48_01725 [Planctomycetaceae bacterium]|nr:hypothetical protein [Planctomycetaceae bacterium]
MPPVNDRLMLSDQTSVSEETEGWQSGPVSSSALPTCLRLLCIAAVEPTWISLTLQLDAEACHEPQFRWISSASGALAILRDESFDCIAISDATGDEESETTFDALALLQAVRASGCGDPCVLLRTRIDDATWSRFADLDCELLISANLWESLALVSVIKRAVSRVELTRENHRLAIANHRRLVRERDEAEHLLGQQRQIIFELETLARGDAEGEDSEDESSPAHAMSPETTASNEAGTARYALPDEINGYYHELLRTYVIMGSGSLGGEISELAELLAVAGLSPRDTLELHLERVETLVRGLGNRSTRHVMARADLLALELMIHLGECYQQRLTEAGK